MVKKGVLVLILLMIFSSAVSDNTYAKNSPRLVDEQDNMHPWGGDDNNNPALTVDHYNPNPFVDYQLRYNYGSKTNLISGLLTVALDEIRYFFFGITATSQPPRDRTAGGSPTSSGFTHPESGPSGGRSGS